jgi:hypothetical protein
MMTRYSSLRIACFPYRIDKRDEAANVDRLDRAAVWHWAIKAGLFAVGELNAGGFESALNCLDRSGFERLPGLQP